ncbi:MAG: tetraacyldisaccharide 4'-kinase [Desulfocapsa sp.]|nr:MAG: tetraacyldisaccharide 4'-kinase [Desulfocapsa sp.]
MSQKFSLLNFLGRPFSPIYSTVMKGREALYRKGIKKSHSLGVPVISVGNLTMGGTGKTPLVAHIASKLLAKGFKPAIISRGYGGAAGNKVNIVSDGNEVFLDAKTAGDEPCFLAHSLPGVHVYTGIVRILPSRFAAEKAGCNVLILDDGFQHLAVKRDLDLVLFSAASLAGNSRVFPGGDLREPISALKRSSAFVITGITEELRERSSKFKEILLQRFPDIPVFFASYEARQAQLLTDMSSCALPTLPSPLFAFCGIGQPQLFQKTLTALDSDICGFMPLRDHQAFTPSLLKKINAKAKKSGAQALITTEKDLVKIRKEHFTLPVFSLQMEVHPEQNFTDFLNMQINGFKP